MFAAAGALTVSGCSIATDTPLHVSDTCPTTGLDQGLYLVHVTDAAQPGESTAQAQVAITDVSGYDRLQRSGGP